MKTSLLYLDTHVVVWLAQNEPQRLSTTGRRLIERSALRISPMVSLELRYLFEIGRLKLPPRHWLPELLRRLDAELGQIPFADVVTHAEELAWSRDPFDRLIVAEAACASAALLTKDELLREHFRKAVW